MLSQWKKEYEEWNPKERQFGVIRLFFASVLVIVCVGAIFGFNALKPLLIESDMYGQHCKSDEAHPCEAQIQNINFIFQFAVSFLNVFGIPMGMVVDGLGCQLSGMISGLLWAFCTILLGYGINNPVLQQMYPYVFLAWGLAGGIFFLAVLNLRESFKAPLKQMSTPILTVCWDVSSIMLALVATIFYTSRIAVSTIFLIWSFSGIGMSIYSYFAFRHTEVAINPGFPIWRAIVSKTLICGCIEMMVAVLQQYFFMSTIAEQTLWITDGNVEARDSLILAFNWMLPALAPIGFAVGTFVDGWAVGKRVPFRRIFLAVLNLIWSGLSITRVIGLQYITYVVYIIWRIYTFICLYSTLKYYFSPRFFGRLAGILLTMGGIATTLSPLLNNTMVTSLNGNPQLVNLTLGCLCVAAHLLGAYGYSDSVFAEIQSDVLPEDTRALQPINDEETTNSENEKSLPT